MSNSNSSSTSDLIYVNPDSTLTESFSSLTGLKPISNSILLDHCRLPPRKPSTKTVLITRYPSTSATSESSLDHPRLYRSVSSLGATHEERMNNTRNALSFAPLPQGKPRRSNSITLGVAARAKMIQSQGGGSNRSQPRYSGPQVWYQPGGSVPPDVYTYKDASAALTKVWSKFKRKDPHPSTAAAAIEKEGKELPEQEYIEDVSPAIVEENDKKDEGVHSDHIQETSR